MKIEKEAIEIIERNPVAFATSTKDGKPHVIATAFVKVKSEKIIITNNCMKTSIENIHQNKHVSIVVWNDKWKGYQIEGVADYFDKGEYMGFVKSMKENKNEPCKGAIVITPKIIKQIG